MSVASLVPNMLDDILEQGLALVVCGTAAGTQSAKVSQYYAGPGNRFWGVLADTGLTPCKLAPCEAVLLPRYGIGLTDLVKGQAGPDSAIAFGSTGASSLGAKMRENCPRVLCFNGKRAAKEFFGVKSVEFGLQTAALGATRLFVAPSTSAAANGAWDASFWFGLADLVRGTGE
jgi:TDG/mug DNA glycosylase family protein